MAHVLDATKHEANLKKLYVGCPLKNHENDIRLLRFADWEHDDDAICCSLECTFGQPYPSYAAISYTWGDPAILSTITVNGLRINIRANCWYALWQVRRLRSNQPVWIDSICINQDDLAEKSAQVFIMGEIYMATTEMYACVGPHENESEHLMLKMPHIVESYNDYRATKRVSRRLKWASSYKYLNARTDILSDMERDSYERLKNAAVAFGNRKYWTRVWVAQEISLSKMQWLLVGNEAVEWPSVATLLLAVETEFVSRRLLQAARDDIRLSYKDRILHMKFKEMFNNYLDSGGVARIAQHEFAASDSRDRIFAIRKLIVWPPMAGQIYPDYTKTNFQVAREMLRYFEAQEDLYLHDQADTLFDFARNLLRILDISAENSEFMDLLRRSETKVTAEAVSSHDHGAGNMDKQICFGVRLGLQRSYHISRRGPAHDTATNCNRKCVFGDATRHWIAVLGLNARRGDVVVRIMKEGMLLVLRECTDFYEIVGTGFVNFRDGACTRGTVCHCYDDAVYIMDKFAFETEIVVNEMDLWSFVSRTWDNILEWDPTGDASDIASGLVDDLCAHSLSSLAIRRPSGSDLLANSGDGILHWKWNLPGYSQESNRRISPITRFV